MNTPKIVIADNGDAFIAYTDGSNGNLYMKKRQSDGTIDEAPTTLLDATDTDGNFIGHYGFHVDGLLDDGKLRFSVARLNAQNDRFSDIIVVEVTP